MIRPDIVWSVPSFTSCINAVDHMIRGRPIRPESLAVVLQPAVANLQAALTEDGLPAAAFVDALLPNTVRYKGNLKLAEWTLRALVGQDSAYRLALRYRGLLLDLQTAFERWAPNLEPGLAPLMPALRRALEQDGFPVLARVGFFTEERVVPQSAEVSLALPASSAGHGWGRAFPSANVAILEAEWKATDTLGPASLLAREVSRLVWLLASLNQDLPIFSEQLSSRRVAAVGALAMLPPVIAAFAGDVQIGAHPGSLAESLSQWLGINDPNSLVDALVQWWETYRHQRPAWSVALRGLDALLGTLPEQMGLCLPPGPLRPTP